MKKVGLLISELNNGGAERVVSRLTQILCDEYKVYLILFEDTYMKYEYSGELINLNIKSRTGFAKLLLPFKRAKALKRIKQDMDLNYVISFLDGPNVTNILSRTSPCKIGISVRNYSKKELDSSFLSKATGICIKYLYNKADIVIPVSRVIAESLVNDYGICRDKQRVIYNPYDIELIRKLGSESLEPQHEEFINQEATFIAVGRYMYQKGFWHLLKAFKVVHDKRNCARLIIVGNDYQNGKVQKLIEELKLSDCVLLTGQQDNPFKFMSRSTVYVLSSLFEGFPNSMVEAMACGCPVIAADCKSGPREIFYEEPDLDKEAVDVEFADFGILVPQLEPEENWESSVVTEAESKLAEVMLLCLEDRDIREKYSKKATERARCFSYETCLQQYMEILQ